MGEFDDRFPSLFVVAYRVAFRVLGDRGEAEDAASEALFRCHRHWRKVSPFAEAWTARVAGNLAIDRRRRRRRTDVDASVSASVENAVVDRIELVRLLAALPRRQRDVVVMRFLADLPESDVARSLGISIGAVKQHAHRGLTTLRSEIATEREDRRTCE